MSQTEELAKTPAPTLSTSLIVPPESLDWVPRWDKTITNDQYHADKTAIGSSALKHMLKSPARFYSRHFLGVKDKDEPSKQMQLGTMIHTALLEPERFTKNFVIMPE